MPYLGTSIHFDFVDLMVNHIFFIVKGFNEIFALLCMGYAFFAWYQEEK